MKRSLIVVIVAVFAFAGCGNSKKSAESSTTTAPTTTTTTTTAPKFKTAGDVTTALKAAGIPIGEVYTYTAENDPNHQLGRPHGYTSKVNFHDTRFELKPDGDAIDSSSGGSVEVFANHDDAQSRSDYISNATKGIAAVTEYDYVQGATLLRVTQVATPDQATAYETALKANHVG